MRTATVLLLFLLAAPSGATSEPSRAQAAPAFQVIVHPGNHIDSADRKLLTDVFLKKRTRWENDEVIRPVDSSPRSPVRQQFSTRVLDRSVAAVKSYWQQLIFSGRGVPPPELATDDEVVSFVLKYPGAIGYVSGSADVRGAKIVQVK